MRVLVSRKTRNFAQYSKAQPSSPSRTLRQGGDCPERQRAARPVLDDWDHLSLRRSPSLVCLFRPRQRPILWTAGRSRSHGAKCLLIEATSARISSADTTASYSRGIDGAAFPPGPTIPRSGEDPQSPRGFFFEVVCSVAQFVSRRKASAG